MAKVTMPQLGESVAEGTIGKWLKQPGDHVAKYEPLLEVITDKVNAEVPSPFEGILREILAEEGATVPNNAEIAVIETADDGAGDATEACRADRSGRDLAAGRARRGPGRARRRRRAGRRRAHPPPTPAVATGPAGSDERRPSEMAAAASAAAVATAPPPRRRGADPDARMTPAVRRLLREHDLSRGPDRRAPAAAAGSPATTSSRSSSRSGPAAPRPRPPLRRPRTGRQRRPGRSSVRPGRATGAGARRAGRRPDRVPATAPTKSCCR